MHIIIISQNQADSIPAMLEAIGSRPATIVLDRCTDGSDCLPFPDSVRVVRNYDGDGFLAGRMRNIGLAHSPEGQDVLFLDGDKVPSGDLDAIPSLPWDAVLMGTSPDRRGFAEGPLPDMGVNPHNGFYSCGLFLRAETIRAVRSLCGQLFHPAFDGAWGEEDRFLGDCLRHIGHTAGYTKTVTLAGALSDFNDRMDDLVRNFLVRLDLRKNLLGWKP